MKQTDSTEPVVPEKRAGSKQNYIVQAWLVLLLALGFGGALAGVQLTLGPTIEANKVNETLHKVPEMVLGFEQARKLAGQNQNLVISPFTISVDKAGRKTFYSVYEAKYPDGTLAGWVTKTGGQGYADKIELLIGLDPGAETITGVFILDQKETPGLGNKIVTPEWRGQFATKATSLPLVVTKAGARGPNEIDAVTGATISSRSVSNIVNMAVHDLHQVLAARASQVREQQQ